MNWPKKACIILLLVLSFSAISSTQAQAASTCDIIVSSAGSDGIYTTPQEKVEISSPSVINGGTPVTSNDSSYFYTIGLTSTNAGFSQALSISNGSFGPIDVTAAANGVVANIPGIQTVYIQVMHNTLPGSSIGRELVCSKQIQFTKSTETLYSCGSPGVAITKTSAGIVNVAVTVSRANLDQNRSYYAYFNTVGVVGNAFQIPLAVDGAALTNGKQWDLNDGTYFLVISDNPDGRALDLRTLKAANHADDCMTTFIVDKAHAPTTDNPGTSFPPPGTTPAAAPPFDLCLQTADASTLGSEYTKCNNCFKSKGIWTAFGCVEYSREGIVTSLLRIGMGIAGGFVLLSILYGAFLLTTSSGDPKRVQEGQEMITSAIMGLLFVIFSIIILKFIGVSIFQIPGFGT